MALQIAFHSNVGELTTTPGTPQTATSTRLGMLQKTSPVIASVPGLGYVLAFQANTGKLIINRGVPQAGLDTGFGMMVDTNPAIAVARDGGYTEIAFHSNNGRLMITDGLGKPPRDLNVALKPGTSPAMPRLGGKVAYHSANGTLGSIFLTPNNRLPDDTHFGMAINTSPSIAKRYTNAFDFTLMIAFQANTGNLFTATGRVRDGVDTQLGMMAGTSPSIVYLADGTLLIAFQANVGRLFTTKGLPSQAFDTGFQMNRASSPAIVLLRDGTPLIAFQAPNGHLMTTQGNFAVAVDTQLGMMAGTTPGIDTERAPVPTISSIKPTHAPVGASIEINGANLILGSAVYFVTSTSTVFAPSTHISDARRQASVPSGVVPGPLLVVLLNESGQANVAFVVDQPTPVPPSPPVISSMNPTAGPNLSVVTFAGKNFTSTKAVSINFVAAEFLVVSDVELRARVPLLTLSGPFIIENADGATTGPTFVVRQFVGLGSISIENKTAGDTITVWVSGRNTATGITLADSFTLAPGQSTGGVQLFTGAVYGWAATAHAAVAEHNSRFPNNQLDPVAQTTAQIFNYQRAAAEGIDGQTGGVAQSFQVF